MNKEYLEALNKAFDYGVQSVLDNLLLRGYSTKSLLEQELLGKTLKKELDEAKEDIRDIETVKQVLTKLDSIDNSNPSEALDSLEKIKNAFGCDMAYYELNLEYEIVEKTLIKSQEQNMLLNIIESEFKFELYAMCKRRLELCTRANRESLEKILEWLKREE